MERKVRRIALFAAAALAALSLAGCGGKEPPATPPPPEDEETAVTYRKGYTPTAFSGNVTNETEKLGEGVRLVKNTVVKTNGNTSVVFAVESMYYGGRAAEGDPHGMNLAELAEFAYFYGCDVAANFDGGGSTQLVVHGDAAARVVVRSSDTGSADLLSTRLVMNSLLVTEKK